VVTFIHISTALPKVTLIQKYNAKVYVLCKGNELPEEIMAQHTPEGVFFRRILSISIE